MILHMAISPYLGHLPISNLGQSFTFNVMLYIYVHPPYVGRPKESSSISRNTFAHSIFILSPQVWAIMFFRTDRVTWAYCACFPNLGLCLHSEPYIFTRESANSIFMLSRGFCKLATCVIWAAVNRIKGGQQRRGSL